MHEDTIRILSELKVYKKSRIYIDFNKDGVFVDGIPIDSTLVLLEIIEHCNSFPVNILFKKDGVECFTYQYKEAFQ